MTFSDSQYDAIMNMYYERQAQNKAAGEQRKKEVYAAIPRIAEIDKSIALTAISAARAGLSDRMGRRTQTAPDDNALQPAQTSIHGTDDHLEDARLKNHSLIAEKEALLKAHGYDADYLKPIYTCPLCRDTGIIDNAYCSCYRQAVISLLYEQSNLNQILSTENFEHFNLAFYSKEDDGRHPYPPYENMYNTVKKIKDFIQTFDETGGNLLFFGETGLGKTFLSNCIAKELLDTGHTVLYQSAVHLFEEVCADVLMKKNQNPKNQNTYRYLYHCDLLIIDDLGTEFTNSFVSSTLYDILNTRIREKKSTLISTNLNLSELTERYSDRISTRIFAAYKVYNFYGSNIRLAKRRQALQN